MTMSETKFDKTLAAIAGYITDNCPVNISFFGKKFSPQQTIATLSCRHYNKEEVTVKINDYKTYIKLQIRFMNKERFPEAFTYFCTLNGLLSELQRALPDNEPAQQTNILKS